MTASWLAALVAIQQVGVTAAIDRDVAVLGEPLTLTIRVEATGDLPVQIVDPILAGLELRGSQEQTTVSVTGNVPTRLTIRTISLVPRTVGTATIGSVVVQIGDSTVSTDPITFRVTAAPDVPAESLDPRIRDFVRQRAPPALRDDGVAVELRAVTDSLVLGEQLDVVVIAWFPRAVRSRLRTPPSLRPPQVAGAWGYQRGVPGATAVSRRVGGRWYDLYVHHQVLFPLRSGWLNVGPATVTYNLPVTFSFLSRELRHEVPSDSLRVYVAPQPASGRPALFDGAAAANLQFAVAVSETALAVGDAAVLSATLSGRGNVALWPEPAFDWPKGVRSYPEEVIVALEPAGGLMGGSKEFRYLVVADSVGVHRIGTPSYAYFDLAAGRYATLRTRSVDLVTGPGATASRVRAASAVRSLMPAPRWLGADRLVSAMPSWGWALLAVVPPLLVGVRRVRLPRRARRVGPESTADRVEGLKRKFRSVLDQLVPEAEHRTDDQLAAALRAAGVEEPLAVHTARVRDRLWQAAYGPESDVDAEELAAEVREVFRALVRHEPRKHRWHVGAALGMLLAVMCAGGLLAQSPQRLYQTGAVRAAADSFALRASQQPWRPDHWYNLAASLGRLDERAEARAAWLRAARLAPRNGMIRGFLDDAELAGTTSRRVFWVSPVTPFECLVLGAALWLIGWILLALRPPRRYGVAILCIAALVAAYGGYVWQRYARPVAVVAFPDTPLRVAPYGSAAVIDRLAEGGGVVVTRIEGNWMLVERGEEQGWVLLGEMVVL